MIGIPNLALTTRALDETHTETRLYCDGRLVEVRKHVSPGTVGRPHWLRGRRPTGTPSVSVNAH